MQILGLAAMVLLVAGASCKQAPRGGDGSPPLARCLQDLDTIPELAALKSHRESTDSANSRPLEGLQIALTLNDLMRSSGDPNQDIDNWCEKENSRENFDKLLAALKQNAMPPTVDFAIGQTLDPALAEGWTAAGNRFGSLTYRHKKSNKSSADEFINDIAANEKTLAPYLPAGQGQAKYFRFPRSKVSLDKGVRDRVAKYLADNGYMVAPATVAANATRFSWIYCSALARGDTACVNLLKAHFKSLLLDTTLKARDSTAGLAGHDVKQVLAVEVNQFACDFLGEILAWYKSLGARFIPLDEALADPFYKLVDEEGNPASMKIIRKVKTAQAQDGQEQ